MNILNVIGETLGQVFGYVLWFFFDLFNNYAIAIVFFTIVIKALMFPFELKSRKASAKTTRLSARTREIQKKYANNQQKMNQELAKVYQEEGSPMKGCMPMIFPILAFLGVLGAIARPLTSMFHISAEKVTAAIDYLSSIPGISKAFNAQYAQLEVIKLFPSVSDKLTMFNAQEISNILDFNAGFKFLGTDLFSIPANSGFASMAWIWPVLCAVTMVLSVQIGTKLNPASADMPQPGCMKLTPYIMSVPFVIFVFYAPVALGLYYLVSNILAIVQNVIIAKFYSPAMVNTKQEAARIALREIEESKVKRL